MSHRKQGFESELERRLELASRVENMGEDLNRRDYVLLGVVTVVIPAMLMVAGWYL